MSNIAHECLRGSTDVDSESSCVDNAEPKAMIYNEALESDSITSDSKTLELSVEDVSNNVDLKGPTKTKLKRKRVNRVIDALEVSVGNKIFKVFPKDSTEMHDSYLTGLKYIFEQSKLGNTSTTDDNTTTNTTHSNQNEECPSLPDCKRKHIQRVMQDLELHVGGMSYKVVPIVPSESVDSSSTKTKNYEPQDNEEVEETIGSENMACTMEKAHENSFIPNTNLNLSDEESNPGETTDNTSQNDHEANFFPQSSPSEMTSHEEISLDSNEADQMQFTESSNEPSEATEQQDVPVTVNNAPKSKKRKSRKSNLQPTRRSTRRCVRRRFADESPPAVHETEAIEVQQDAELNQAPEDSGIWFMIDPMLEAKLAHDAIFFNNYTTNDEIPFSDTMFGDISDMSDEENPLLEADLAHDAIFFDDYTADVEIPFSDPIFGDISDMRDEENPLLEAHVTQTASGKSKSELMSDDAWDDVDSNELFPELLPPSSLDSEDSLTEAAPAIQVNELVSIDPNENNIGPMTEDDVPLSAGVGILSEAPVIDRKTYFPDSSSESDGSENATEDSDSEEVLSDGVGQPAEASVIKMTSQLPSMPDFWGDCNEVLQSDKSIPKEVNLTSENLVTESEMLMAVSEPMSIDKMEDTKTCEDRDGYESIPISIGTSRLPEAACMIPRESYFPELSSESDDSEEDMEDYNIGTAHPDDVGKSSEASAITKGSALPSMPDFWSDMIEDRNENEALQREMPLLTDESLTSEDLLTATKSVNPESEPMSTDPNNSAAENLTEGDQFQCDIPISTGTNLLTKAHVIPRETFFPLSSSESEDSEEEIEDCNSGVLPDYMGQSSEIEVIDISSGSSESSGSSPPPNDLWDDIIVGNLSDSTAFLGNQSTPAELSRTFQEQATNIPSFVTRSQPEFIGLIGTTLNEGNEFVNDTRLPPELSPVYEAPDFEEEIELPYEQPLSDDTEDEDDMGDWSNEVEATPESNCNSDIVFPPGVEHSSETGAFEMGSESPRSIHDLDDIWDNIISNMAFNATLLSHRIPTEVSQTSEEPPTETAPVVPEDEPEESIHLAETLNESDGLTSVVPEDEPEKTTHLAETLNECDGLTRLACVYSDISDDETEPPGQLTRLACVYSDISDYESEPPGPPGEESESDIPWYITAERNNDFVLPLEARLAPEATMNAMTSERSGSKTFCNYPRDDSIGSFKASEELLGAFPNANEVSLTFEGIMADVETQVAGSEHKSVDILEDSGHLTDTEILLNEILNPRKVTMASEDQVPENSTFVREGEPVSRNPKENAIEALNENDGLNTAIPMTFENLAAYTVPRSQPETIDHRDSSTGTLNGSALLSNEVAIPAELSHSSMTEATPSKLPKRTRTKKLKKRRRHLPPRAENQLTQLDRNEQTRNNPTVRMTEGQGAVTGTNGPNSHGERCLMDLLQDPTFYTDDVPLRPKSSTVTSGQEPTLNPALFQQVITGVYDEVTGGDLEKMKDLDNIWRNHPPYWE